MHGSCPLSACPGRFQPHPGGPVCGASCLCIGGQCTQYGGGNTSNATPRSSQPRIPLAGEISCSHYGPKVFLISLRKTNFLVRKPLCSYSVFQSPCASDATRSRKTDWPGNSLSNSEKVLCYFLFGLKIPLPLTPCPYDRVCGPCTALFCFVSCPCAQTAPNHSGRREENFFERIVGVHSETLVCIYRMT